MKTYDIAAYIWPSYTNKEPRSHIFWPNGVGEWQTVQMVHEKENGTYHWERKPVWGYVDEADPKEMHRQIEEATAHGVNTFIYDWYWYDDRPFLEQCLNEGFLGADNHNKMKFYLMWANHDANYTWDYRNSDAMDTVVWRGEVTDKQFDKIGDRWIEKYFGLENYYRIDGKPVVAIYDIGNFIGGLGGVENAAKALAALKEKAKAAGLGGVHLQLIKWGDYPINLSGVDGGAISVTPELVKTLGFDSLTHYQIVHFTNVSRDYLEIIPDMVKEWEKTAERFGVAYYPHVSIGWDNNPRFKSFHPDIVKNNTPENFKKALLLAKDFCDKSDIHPLITVNSWNEWTETSYLEPDDVNGYGYLDAIKEVFLG